MKEKVQVKRLRRGWTAFCDLCFWMAARRSWRDAYRAAAKHVKEPAHCLEALR